MYGSLMMLKQTPILVAWQTGTNTLMAPTLKTTQPTIFFRPISMATPFLMQLKTRPGQIGPTPIPTVEV